MSYNKKFIIFTLAVLISSYGLYLVVPRVYNFFAMRKVAQAIGSMPWEFGGFIAAYQPVCVATPPDGICKNCLQCTTALGPYICAGYTEIDFTPAPGSMPPMYVCPTQGYFYQGGGVIPKSGSYLLGGGMSPAFPMIIGISL